MVRIFDAPKDPNLRDHHLRRRTASPPLLTTPKPRGVALLQPTSYLAPKSSPSSLGLRSGLDIFHPRALGIRPHSHTFLTRDSPRQFHESSHCWTPKSILLSGGSAQRPSFHNTTPIELEKDQLPSAKLGPIYIVASMAFAQSNVVPGTNAPTASAAELEEVNTSVCISSYVSEDLC
jgi:hypothetical protein